jgi:hypothetical protein
MKRFTCHRRCGDIGTDLSELEALSCLWHSGDARELLDLEVGASFEDADGDQWERTVGSCDGCAVLPSQVHRVSMQPGDRIICRTSYGGYMLTRGKEYEVTAWVPIEWSEHEGRGFHFGPYVRVLDDEGSEVTCHPWRFVYELR